MVGLVWTAVFASRWNAMMKLTMMKVRIGDILGSGGHQFVMSKHLWEINYTSSRQPYRRKANIYDGISGMGNLLPLNDENTIQ
jgi:hypothetical protein